MKRGIFLAVRAAATIAAALAIAVPGEGRSQIAAWRPQKTVEIIVGTSPGGGNDRMARTIQKIWHERQLVETPSVVVNKPGGGGNIGTRYLNEHPADGHYLMVATATMLTNYLTGRGAYTHKDVTPIAYLFDDYVACAVRADSPVKSGRELLERLKTDPASLSVGLATSIGNHNHVALALAAKAAGADIKKIKVVVFQSTGDATTALLGGHIDAIMSTPSTLAPQMQSRTVRSVANSSPLRMGGVFSTVPTWKEQGFDVVVVNWRIIAGPRGMSQQQTAHWDTVFARLAQTDEWRTETARQLWGDHYMNSRDSARYMEREYELLRTVLIELGLIKPEASRP